MFQHTKTMEPPAATQRIQYATPLTSVRETPDRYVLEAEMPGVDKSGVEVTLEDHSLTIVGRRPHEKLPGTVIHAEFSHADYRRTFEINAPVDASRISAKIEQGLLTVSLPKAEESLPKSIPIEG
jgi:HSP20 family protein